MHDKGCDIMFSNVKLICGNHGVDIPKLNYRHQAGKGRSRDPNTTKHHFRIDIFSTKIDSQLNEFNHIDTK